MIPNRDFAPPSRHTLKAERMTESLQALEIRRPNAKESHFVAAFLLERWGSARWLEGAHHLRRLPYLMAKSGDKLLGCLSYCLERDAIEILIIGRRVFTKAWHEVVQVHAGAVNQARLIKASIPFFGNDGLPITVELEYEWLPLQATS